ncbi:MAG: DNA-binding protein [Cyanobacteria bacterium REEB67]|nr:DNA-binding protein [Cyanobacteria bacterium REEB67]
MNFSSIISNHALPLVFDTSIVVNLQACTFGKQIVAAVPNPIIIAQIAADELKQGTIERAFLDDLLTSNLVQLSELADPEYREYESLITTLDDGESATIALSISRQFFPFIDERKGRTKATERQAMLDPGWSLDLLRHPNAVEALGSPSDADAVYLALKEGRMRIPEARVNDVISLIGTQRASGCVSLPNYKKLFPKKAT